MVQRRCWDVWRLCIFMLVSFAVVACNGSGSVIHSYIASSQSSVALVVWREEGNGMLTGRFWYNGVAQGITGLSQGTHYTFRFPAETITGTLRNATLTMPIRLHETAETWYPGSLDEYNQLTAAFQAYQLVAGTLTDLKQFQRVKPLPLDSNPGYYHQALLAAQKRVTDEQHALVSLQRADSRTCASLVAFEQQFPRASQDALLELPHAQTFPLVVQSALVSDIVATSGIGQRVQALSSAYQQAKSLPFPTVKGLAPPWQIVPGQDLVIGQQQVQALQLEISTDAPLFATAQAQATTIQTQVNGIRQTAGCA